MNKTKIEWCTRTLNPVVGCTFGCSYCYARAINNRFNGVHPESFAADFTKPQFFPDRLKQLNEKSPQIIFMDSMSDIADWPLKACYEIMDAQRANPQHVYLHLSKRPDKIKWKSTQANFWYGVSITSNTTADKERLEFTTDAVYFGNNHLFVSIEPLLEELDQNTLDNLYMTEWIIIGAETGNRKGKVTPEREWIDEITEYAKSWGIPIFMKGSLIPIMGEENMIREYPESITEWFKKGKKR